MSDDYDADLVREALDESMTWIPSERDNDKPCLIRDAKEAFERILARERAAAEWARAEAEPLREALEDLRQFAEAYPPDVFIEPTKGQWLQAHEALVSVGLTIDKFSGSIYRRILKRVGEIVNCVLPSEPQPAENVDDK